MNELLQRLKDLDPERFHQLIYCILRERHSGIDIKQVAGKGGDKGVDIFRGELQRGPVIWQVKFFPNGVRKVQRKQIKASFVRALENFRPREWFLCMPVDLDINGHAWFEQLQRDYAATVKVCLFAGTQVALELLHHRTIRNSFFPNVPLDVDGLKALMLKTAQYTTEELARVTEENVDQYVQRLREKDSRFYYEVAFAAEGGFADRGLRRRPVFSASQGNLRVDLYPRDREALRLDPPQVRIRLKGQARRKMEELVRTGSAQEFKTEEVVNFSTSFDRIFPHEGTGRLVLGPAVIENAFRYRVTFSGKSDKVEYPLVEFRTLRVGTEEAELLGESPTQGFEFRLVLGRALNDYRFELSFDLHGREVQSLEKTLRAIRIVTEGGMYQLFDLDREGVAFQGQFTSATLPEGLDKARNLLDALMEVSHAYGLRITYPAAITHEDTQAINKLLQIARTGKLSYPSASGTGEILRGDGDASEVLDLLKDGCMFAMENPQLQPPILLFGQEIETGPTMTTMRAKIEDIHAFHHAYLQAEPGTAVTMRFTTSEPGEVVFMRFAKTKKASSEPHE